MSVAECWGCSGGARVLRLQPSGACASACVGGGARDPSAPGTAVFCYLNPTRVGARIDPLSTLLPAACGCARGARAGVVYLTNHVLSYIVCMRCAL